MIKKVLADRKELNLSLLQYRNTPILENCSLSQLLMSRTARTLLPMQPAKLKPKLANVKNYNNFIRNEQKYNEEHYNHKTGAKTLKPLEDGTNVLFQAS